MQALTYLTDREMKRFRSFFSDFRENAGYFLFFYPPPNLFGVGAMASPWTSVRYRNISRKSMGDYFRIAPTHHLGDVDMPFGGYDL